MSGSSPPPGDVSARVTRLVLTRLAPVGSLS